MKKIIALLPGDGIGPEVTRAAVDVLGDCAATFGHQFEFRELPFGGCAIDLCGNPLPPETLAFCHSADAVLLGAIGGPKWDAMPLGTRPEAGLLGIRKELDLYINLRPIKVRDSLRGISPLRPERLEGCNFDIVRELAGDIYFGAHEIHGEKTPAARATDVAQYSAAEVTRVARYAFERAAGRKKHVTSVDKANVLATSTLWRQTVVGLAGEYPGVTLDHLLVDNAAMQIMINPKQFDVMLTGNMFGDILSDEASALAGSIGLIPSMSRGDAGHTALYEPIHGSAPTLAGKDIASPLGAVFSAAMMLEESFGMKAEARWIEAAVDRVLDRGYRTADIAEPGGRAVRGSEMTAAIRSELRTSNAQSSGAGSGAGSGA